MSFQAVIVGVDGSPESAAAARFGYTLASQFGVPCRLAHAVPEYWSAMPPELGFNTQALDERSVEQARRLIMGSLESSVPQSLIDTLEGQVGHCPIVLARVAAAHDAGVIVMGGKRRRGLARLAGSAINQLVRLGELPVLAHDGRATPIRKILAAVDLTQSARGTIASAESWAEKLGAQVRVLHVVEPLPVVPGVKIQVPEDQVYRSTHRHAERELQPFLGRADTGLVIRRGRSVAGIVTEAREWGADLIVTSSHGKNWMDRLVIGSTSERLLHVLPAPVMVLPVVHAVRPREAVAAAMAMT